MKSPGNKSKGQQERLRNLAGIRQEENKIDMTPTIKKIRVAGLVLAGLLGAGGLGYALQAPPGPAGPMGGPMRGPGGLPRLQQLANQLGLTDAQKTQIKGILDNARTQLQALRSNMNITKQQEMDQTKQIVDQTKASIQALLTPAQQATAEQLKQQAQAKMAAHQEKMEERMLARMTQQLGLSDSQQSSIKTILANQKSQLEALKSNTSLTQQQRFDQMKTIRQQTQDQIKGVLTADQQATLQQLRANPPRRFGRRGPGGPGPMGAPGLAPMRGLLPDGAGVISL